VIFFASIRVDLRPTNRYFESPSGNRESRMSTFEKREKAEETKHARDTELKFKANARRNKLFGLWVAELLGMKGETAEAYAKQVVLADFDEPGHDDVIRKVKGDLGKANVALSDHDLHRKFESLLAIAADQVKTEAAKA
jgi:hypothetical protein